jgi:hypothetical protein
MEDIAFDDRAGHSFTAEDFFKGGPHSTGAGTRGAGDYNYGVLFGQVSRPWMQAWTSEPNVWGLHLRSRHHTHFSPGHVRAYGLRSAVSIAVRAR